VIASRSAVGRQAPPRTETAGPARAPPPPFEGVQVLSSDAEGRLALVTVFLDPALAARFGTILGA